MELVILAAGMGSRFGGLKQIEPIDEWGNFIIDYSVFDAIEAGFDKIIFVIKEELQKEFEKTIGNRLREKVEVEYVYQKIDDVPFINNAIDRKKPWGTGHAVLAARNAINEKFLIINSDDFYGKEAFLVAYNFLKTLPSNSKGNYANIAFRVSNTLTENGGVKRGVCFYDDEKKLEGIIESVIIEQNKKIIATPLDEKLKSFEVDFDQLVSMNMFAFSCDFLSVLEEEFRVFCEENSDKLETCEFLTTDIISKLIKTKKATVQILETKSIWHGVTYKKDKEKVVNEIKKLVDLGQYKKGLW